MNKKEDNLETELISLLENWEKNTNEVCPYHKEWNQLQNKNELIKALQVILKIVMYHDKEKLIPTQFKVDILALISMISQESVFQILEWYLTTKQEIEKEKIKNQLN